MADSRDYILSTIRRALDAALLPGAALERPVNRTPRPAGGVDRFIAELEQIAGRVIRVGSAGEAAGAAAALFAERGWDQALTWEWDEIGCAGLPEAFERAGIQAVQDGEPAALAGIPVGLTGAEAAIADTGTIVVRNGSGRSSLASLLPPVHVALVDASRVFPDMRGYLESLASQGGAASHVRETGNLVFISGPSRTADIEQTLTLGVHGPGELIIVLWG